MQPHTLAMLQALLLNAPLAVPAFPAQAPVIREADFSFWYPDEALEVPLPGGPASGARFPVHPPLAFERNDGQTDARVAFFARGRGYHVFLGPLEAALVLHSGRRSAPAAPLNSAGFEAGAARANSGWTELDHELPTPPPRVLRMRFVEANAQPSTAGEELLRARVNYFIGNEPSRWRTRIPTFGRVHYRAIYPGIDLVFYGKDGQLEYDFIVAPGGDPNRIKLEFEGADEVWTDERGDLVLTTGDREVRWRKPIVYQEANGNRLEVQGTYRLQAGSPESDGPVRTVRFVSFELAAYDRTRSLVIDPKLVYSTTLDGASQDWAGPVDVDYEGNAYVLGDTQSVDFPVKDALFGELNGTERDLYVAKFSPKGELLFSTYLGGTDSDGGPSRGSGDLAVTPSGDCWITSGTRSVDFPLVNPLQDSHAGGQTDIIVAKVRSDGSELMFSSYLGGSESEWGQRMTFGPKGDIYLVGSTHSTDFPTTNAFQAELSAPASTSDLPYRQRDACLVRLAPEGKGVVYSTFYGQSSTIESGWDVVVDAEENVYLTAWISGCFVGDCSEVLLSKVSGDGSKLLFEKRIRGASETLVMQPYVALGRNGRVVLGANTNLRSLPARNMPPVSSPGYTDAYVAQFDGASGNFEQAIYLGGGGNDDIKAVFFDPAGDIIVVGNTTGPEFNPSGFPVTDPIDASLIPGTSTGIFVAKLRADDLAVTFSTLVAGPQHESAFGAALARNGDLAMAGHSVDQYGPDGKYQALVVRLGFGDRLTIRRSGERLTLSWPASATGYELERAVNSAPNTAWEKVSDTPALVGGDWVVNVQLEGAMRFFRLRQP